MEIKLSPRVRARQHPILSKSPLINLFKPAMQFGSNYAPRLTGWVGFQLLCHPMKRKISVREKGVLDQAWQWKIAFEGKSLQLYSWGEGPTVLFVHGWESNASTWRHYVGALVDSGYRVVAFDAPAHGRSSGSTLTPVLYMRAIKAVQEDIGEPYAIISHSIGALSTLLAFENHISPNSNPMVLPEKMILLSPLVSVVELYDYSMTMLNVPTSISKVVREYGYKSQGEKAVSFSAIDTLSGFNDTELLIVQDKNDPIVFYKISENLSKAAPNAQFILTSGLGHLLRHEEVVSKVLSFIGNK
jgi:esterase/lipase